MIIGGIVTVVALGSILLGDHGVPSFLKLRAERRALEAEVENLRAREATLAADIEALEQDPEVLERVARERYRMHKPGETVIEVIGGSGKEDVDNPTSSP
jgi:cell division protein FtsB